MISSERKSFTERQNSGLLAIQSNDADLSGADFPVDPSKGGRRKTITRRERATSQDTLSG